MKEWGDGYWTGHRNEEDNEIKWETETERSKTWEYFTKFKEGKSNALALKTTPDMGVEIECVGAKYWQTVSKCYAIAILGQTTTKQFLALMKSPMMDKSWHLQFKIAIIDQKWSKHEPTILESKSPWQIKNSILAIPNDHIRENGSHQQPAISESKPLGRWKTTIPANSTNYIRTKTGSR